MFAFSCHVGVELLNSFTLRHYFIRLRLADAFVKVVVAHHHRCGAAASQAFDEFDRELSILRRLQTVRVRAEAQLLAKMLVQRIRTAKRAAQRAEKLDLVLPDRLLPKPRIKRHQFVNVDGLQAELARRPFDGFLREPTELFLEGVEQHQRRTALLRVMGDQLVDLGFEVCWDGKGHCQKNLCVEAPNPKLQIPKKLQKPNSKCIAVRPPAVGACCLEFVWSWDVGSWSFFIGHTLPLQNRSTQEWPPCRSSCGRV